MKPPPRGGGNQFPAPSPGRCGPLLNHLSAQKALFLSRTCGVPHEHISCAQPPTPQGKRCTPRRAHAVPNGKFFLHAALPINISRTRDQIALPRVHPTPVYRKVHQRDTARQYNPSSLQEQEYKVAVPDRINKRIKEKRARRNVADCSLHEGRESILAGEAFLAEPPASMESRVHVEDNCIDTAYSADVPSEGASSDSENLLTYGLPKHTGTQRKSRDHGGRATSFCSAVTDIEGLRQDKNAHDATKILNDNIHVAWLCNCKLSCCPHTKLHAHAGFTTSVSKREPNAAYESRKEPVIAYKHLLHAAPVGTHPHPPCKQRWADDRFYCRTADVEETPPCSPRGKKGESTVGLHCRGQDESLLRHEMKGPDPKEEEQEYLGTGGEVPILRSSASAAGYEQRYGVLPSQHLRNSSLIAPKSPQRGSRRVHAERHEDVSTESPTACQLGLIPVEIRKGLHINTADERVGKATHRLRSDSTLCLHNQLKATDLPKNDSRMGWVDTHALPADHGKSSDLNLGQPQKSESKLRTSPHSKTSQAAPIAKSTGTSNHSNACQLYGPTGEEIVTHEQIVSLLESCSMKSIYGPDVERNDPSSSFFHSCRAPSISLRDYYFHRIVKYSEMSATDLVMSVLYMNKLLIARSPRVSASHSAAAGQLWAHSRVTPPKSVSETRNNHPPRKQKPLDGRMGTEEQKKQFDGSPRAYTANEAVEFNALTAHRLLLTASLLANKVHYDRHLVLKHWAKTCKRIRLADSSLLLKGPPATSLQQFQPHCPVFSKARALKRTSCAQGRGDSPLTAGSLCRVSESENDCARTSSVLRTLDASTASSLSLLSNPDPPEKFVQIKNTTSTKESCLVHHRVQVQNGEGEQRSAQKMYAEDAATKHRTRQERRSTSGQAQAPSTDFNTEARSTQIPLHSRSRQELWQQNFSTRTQCKLHKPVIQSAGKTCAETSISRRCTDYSAHTSGSLLTTDGKNAGETPGSPNTSSSFQRADHLMGAHRSTRRPAGARTPQSNEHTSPQSYSSSIMCHRSAKSDLERPENPNSGHKHSPLRKFQHTEITEEARGRNSAPTAPRPYIDVVAYHLAQRKGSQDALNNEQGGSFANTTDKRMAAEPFSDTDGKARQGIPPTCILCTPNRSSSFERRKSETSVKSFVSTSEPFYGYVAPPLWQTPPLPIPAVGRSGCHSGTNCGVVCEDAPRLHVERKQETLEIGSGALARRASPETFTYEWKTTTATAFEGASEREEFNKRNTPRPTLSKLPRGQEIHQGHVRRFQSQLPCNLSFIERNMEKSCQDSLTGLAAGAVKVPLSQQLLNPQPTLFLPA